MNAMPLNLPTPTDAELLYFRDASPVEAIEAYRARTGIKNETGTINFWHWIRTHFERTIRARRPDVEAQAALDAYHGATP